MELKASKFVVFSTKTKQHEWNNENHENNLNIKLYYIMFFSGFFCLLLGFRTRGLRFLATIFRVHDFSGSFWNYFAGFGDEVCWHHLFLSKNAWFWNPKLIFRSVLNFHQKNILARAGSSTPVGILENYHQLYHLISRCIFCDQIGFGISSWNSIKKIPHGPEPVHPVSHFDLQVNSS